MKKGETMKKVEPPPMLQNVPIMYKGKEVAQVNGTIPEYRVEIWSGAHPAWQGKNARVSIDDTSCVKFQEKFGDLSDIFGAEGKEKVDENRKLRELDRQRR